jgi:hypothetical protein
MDKRKMVKQLIDFHKTYFENCFSMMVSLQQQAENILNFFYYFPIMTDEGKNFMKQRTDLYKKWIDDLKKAVNEGYAKVEELYNNHEVIVSLHDQTQKIFNSYLSQTTLMPADLKNLLGKLDILYKNGCDEFMKYVEENRQQVVNFYNTTSKSQTKAKK